MADQAHPGGGGAARLSRIGRAVAGPVTVSVILAFVIGGAVIAAGGANPFTAYPSMFTGSLTGRGLVDTFARAIPIIGMGIAVSVAFRAGVFNLGIEGQLVLGALAGALVALTVPGPGFLVMLLAVVTAVVVGGLWGVLSAVMETRFGVPILISSLLLNFVGRYASSYLVRFPFKEPGSSLVATRPVPDGTRIPALIPARSGLGRALADDLGSRNLLVLMTRGVNWSLVVLIALVIAVAIFNKRTASGYETGMAGLNARFARYGGVRTKRMRIWVMFASGGISGLVGVMFILGGQSQYRVIDNALVGTNYAWTGLLVALLAFNRPVGVAIAGFFFAVLVVGGEAMQRDAGVASQIAQVIQAVVIILLVFRVGISWRGRRRETPSGAADFVPTGEVANAADVEPGRV